MGIYQPSSGALYPVLRRLGAKGLVRAVALDGASESARRRRVYEPTDVGRTAH
jgi:DNA-binding PadR family transcriptional regulator